MIVSGGGPQEFFQCRDEHAGASSSNPAMRGSASGTLQQNRKNSACYARLYGTDVGRIAPPPGTQGVVVLSDGLRSRWQTQKSGFRESKPNDLQAFQRPCLEKAYGDVRGGFVGGADSEKRIFDTGREHARRWRNGLLRRLSIPQG